MNKVIFLDVDGVLNNGTWAIEMFDKGIRVYHDDLLYEPSLEQLRRIVDTTGAVIVVSSSWRQIPIAYPGIIDCSNTPSRFGTVPGFEGVLPLSHHNAACRQRLALSRAFPPLATTWLVIRRGHDRGNRGGQCANAMTCSWGTTCHLGASYLHG